MSTLKDAVSKYGIENIRIYISMPKYSMVFPDMSFGITEASDEKVLCTLSEEVYKFENEYKVTLKPMLITFASHHFYISDLETIIQMGHATIFVAPLDGEQLLKEPDKKVHVYIPLSRYSTNMGVSLLKLLGIHISSSDTPEYVICRPGHIEGDMITLIPVDPTFIITSFSITDLNSYIKENLICVMRELSI